LITEDGHMGGTCSRYEVVEIVINIFIRKSEGTLKYIEIQ